MVGLRPRRRALLSAGSVILCSLAAAVLAAGPAEARFQQAPFPVPGHKYFDLGLADADLDGDLDVYSSNHNYRAVLLANDGEGELAPAAERARYVPMPAFPGMEDLFSPPDPTGPGLYLYAVRSSDPRDGRGVLVLQTVDLPGGAQVDVGFTERQVAAAAHWGAEVSTGRRDAGFGAKVRVRAEADALVTLTPTHLDLPIRVRVGDSVPVDRIGVGAELIRPADHGFDLRFRDRHGVGWADYDGDGAQDAFIAGGGLSTSIAAYEAVVSDELLLGERRRLRFADGYGSSRLRKGSCRSREALPLDYNLDGAIDLFIGCEGERPTLALGRGNGKLRERSRRVGAVAVERRTPAYRWLQLDGRPGLELAVAHQHGLRTYGIAGGSLEPWQDLGGRHDRGIGGIAVGDFDRDRDPDLLVSSAGGVTLYTNRRGSLTQRDPRRFGLPGARVRAASWVDFDNDGALDLHAHPRGVWRAAGEGRFQRTAFLRDPEPTGEARVSWGDLDGNGTLEPVSVTRVPHDNVWVPRRYVNRGRARHWLAVDVGGPGGAAAALGARVAIRTAAGRQTAWVGQLEGSRFSAGNRRVHFGLGNRERVRWVKVRWPDGERTKLRRPAADRVVEVSRR